MAKDRDGVEFSEGDVVIVPFRVRRIFDGGAVHLDTIEPIGDSKVTQVWQAHENQVLRLDPPAKPQVLPLQPVESEVEPLVEGDHQ